MTRNEFGDGIGWYVGTIVEETEFYDKLIASVLNDAEIRPIVQPPPGVEAATRASAERTLLFLINHTPEQQTPSVPLGNRELLTGRQTGETVKLEPFGVAVVELPVQSAKSSD
ncbi:MAG: Beta-galactosidase C-terminal domain [Pirellulales bacterium]